MGNAEELRKKELFPSPGGDMLKQLEVKIMSKTTRFPSPGGDMLKQEKQMHKLL